MAAKSATVSARGESKSPKTSNNASPTRADATSIDKSDVNSDKSTDASDGTKPLEPLAPPPNKPNGTSSETISAQPAGSLSLEPNPFEQSFGAPGAPETPGGTKLPSVAALTSPSSLLPGAATPFNWGVNSLRTGPLSPAMLSGPAQDYFSEQFRGGFTPNESSLRTGLTPGGGGSMFPSSPGGSSALFAQLQNGTATPGTLDFHRTALNANAKQNHPLPPPVTSQPQDISVKAESKASTGQLDLHDSDAANGLFMLANQGRNAPANQTAYASAPQPQVHAHPVSMPLQAEVPQMNGGGSVGNRSARGASEVGSAHSDESQPTRPITRGKGKRNSGASATAGRRKAENEPPAKAPASKKVKANGGYAMPNFDMEPSSEEEEDEDAEGRGDNPKSKMTDEEKRKNFLERNRVAALKCRQRKKQWLANLQSKVELFGSENDALTSQISQLREEVVNLKTLLLAHKDCPVTQQQGLHNPFMQQQAAMDSYSAQMNPYNMAGPAIPPQPVLAGQVGQRRYS